LVEYFRRYNQHFARILQLPPSQYKHQAINKQMIFMSLLTKHMLLIRSFLFTIGIVINLLPAEFLADLASRSNKLFRISSLSTTNLFDKIAATGAGGAICFSI
jgi:hypothetical protein